MSVNYGWKPSQKWSCEAPPLEIYNVLVYLKKRINLEIEL